MKEEWLLNGAVVPVEAERAWFTIAELNAWSGNHMGEIEEKLHEISQKNKEKT